jgi:hypothetical protein
MEGVQAQQYRDAAAAQAAFQDRQLEVVLVTDEYDSLDRLK